MAYTKEMSFQHYMRKLDERFPNKEMLSKSDVQRFTGLDPRAAVKIFPINGNYISKAKLAEAMS